MKRFFGIIVCFLCFLSIAACQNVSVETETSNHSGDVQTEKKNEEKELEILVEGKKIPVIWEKNETVEELKEEASKSDIRVKMSMYGGNEQVGSLGRTYTRNDQQMTTKSGDIVLYSGDHIVLFYGSNSWSYTLLGKIDLSEKEMTQLLSHGDVEITIKR